MSSEAARSMDRMYGWQSRIYDLTRKPYLLGRDHLITDLRPPPGGTILEIGCGTARNLAQAARLYPDSVLFGIDVSSVMIDTASRTTARAGLQSRISLRQCDAEGLRSEQPFSRSHFDRVFISYALSMIHSWREVLASSLMLVSPGGSLHVVDFGRGEDLPAPFMRALNTWLGMFSVTPRGDLEQELFWLAALESGSRTSCARLRRGYAIYGKVERPQD